MVRQRGARSGGAGPAAAVAILLLAVAGGTLFGVFWWLDRRAEAERARAEAAKQKARAVALAEVKEDQALAAKGVPFDRIRVDGGEYRLIVVAGRRWGARSDGAATAVQLDKDAIENVTDALARCARFLTSKRFHSLYPEAKDKRTWIELDFAVRPPASVVARIRSVVSVRPELKDVAFRASIEGVPIAQASEWTEKKSD